MRATTRQVDIALFSEQLALMIAASVPINRALEIAAKAGEENLAAAVRKIHWHVEGGRRLSTAMGEFRQIFTPTYLVMIKVGEQTGTLVEVLRSLADTARKSGETRAKVRSATIYPATLFGASFLMIAFLVGYMLPNFLTIIPGDADLPWLTSLVVGISTSPILLYGVPICLVTVTAYISRAQTTEIGRAQLSKIKLMIPGVGKILRQFAVIRLCQNLVILREGGLDLYRSLTCLESETTGDTELDLAIREVRLGISSGESLGRSMLALPVFPKLLSMIVLTSEETGELDRSLKQYVKLSTEDLQTRIDSFVSIIEPLTMAVMGFLVGIILIAAFLPTYQLMLNI